MTHKDANRITANWIDNPATQKVFDAIQSNGGQALFVGGCVRNALLGVPVSDIDISTDVEPETVIKLAARAGIKAVPTGIDHGTVTLISGGLTHEVTTFRKDIDTDGRRAVVAFSDRIEDDAARRDFTMNALYACPDGTLVDPLGGMVDLNARRVRFIGRATDRIKEDYLRSLRYFRFHAWYGDAQAGFDADALAAIAKNLDGLAHLSRERVGSEMLKLLGAPDPAPSVAAMRSVGMLNLFLPGADDQPLAPLVYLETQAGVAADPLRRLAVLGGTDTAGALRLSRARASAVDKMRDAGAGSVGAGELGYRYGSQSGRDALLLRCAWFEQPWDTSVERDLDTGANAIFPVRARDLMPGLQGRAIGKRLVQLESDWISSGFTKTKSELLADPD